MLGYTCLTRAPQASPPPPPWLSWGIMSLWGLPQTQHWEDWVPILVPRGLDVSVGQRKPEPMP